MLEYCDIRSEHDDFFAERRRRWSDTYKGVPDSDEEDEVDSKEKKNDVDKIEDTKLKVTNVGSFMVVQCLCCKTDSFRTGIVRWQITFDSLCSKSSLVYVLYCCI